MSVLISAAARRTYDALKERPGANPRHSGARDAAVLQAITDRILQLVAEYRINEQRLATGAVYVYWVELAGAVEAGVFDDMLDRL